MKHIIPNTVVEYTHSAGILPVLEKKVLLGRERRGWSAFSGKSEYGESPRDTAIREFKEETANIFGEIKLEDIHLKTMTPRGLPFFLFFSKFDHEFEHVDHIFQTHRVNARHTTEREKIEIRWIHINNVCDLKLSKSFEEDWAEIRNMIELNLVHE